MPDLSDADFLRSLAINDYGIPEIRETNARIRSIAASLESRSAEPSEPRAQSPEQTPWSDEDAEIMGFGITLGKGLTILDDTPPGDASARWFSWKATVALSRWLAAKVEQNT